MAKLKITDERGNERLHELIDSSTTIGRASINVIQISDEKSSRQHFKIEKEGDVFKVFDLGSTNGTRLNGAKIAAPTVLKPGDELGLGQTTFVFEPLEKNAKAPVNTAATQTDGLKTMDLEALDPSVETEKPAPKHALTEPKYVLKVLEGAEPGKIYELGVEALTLGRHSSNTIQIIDEAASNYHAEVSREPIGFVLTDLGSTNGTKVKGANRPDFEKVVKTPLNVGMQIRVGKTLLEFQNIGGHVDEDPLFGTISLDPQKLEDSLAPQKKSGFPIGKVAALVAVIGLGVVAIPILLNKIKTAEPAKGPDKGAQKVNLENKIANAGFDQGTDDEGNPKEFSIEKGAPGIQIKVIPDADRLADKKEAGRLGLQIGKSGGKSLSTQTVVETRESFAIDAGKVYELGGWLRNDGDGLYGLRVTWLQGDRVFSENPVVLKQTQEWKEKTANVTPPAWAERAKIGVFVQGKDGRACFDDLSFKEKPSATPQQPAAVKFGGVALQFEGAKGSFSATSQGKTVIEDGTLRLETPDGKSASDLAAAVDPQLKKGAENSAAEYTGRLYDFALESLTNYLIQAQPGASGVDMRLAIDLPSEAASRPVLRFYVTGAAGQGDIEVSKGDENSERLSSTEDKVFPGTKSVLFNAGKTPQLALAFTKPVEARLKREGKRRLVEIRFDGDVSIAFAPEDGEQKQRLMAAVSDMQKAIAAQTWADAEAKIKALNEKFGARFQQAKDESTKARDQIDAAWKAVQEELNRTIASLGVAANKDLIEKARATVQRHQAAWAGSEKVATLGDTLAQIDGIAKTVLKGDVEKKAEEYYKQAEGYFEKKIYNVAVSILKVKILDDPECAQTETAKKARELLPKAEAAEQRQGDLNRISDRLQTKIKNYKLAKNYSGAIKEIESDKEYLANKADLTEITKLVEELRKLQ